MPDRLHVLSLPDVGHFGIIEADRQTKEYRATESWRDLCDEIKALPDVKLILLDTLQSLTTGDTNTVEATQPLMNEATALAAETGACVLLIHHVAKGSTKELRSSLDAMEAIGEVVLLPAPPAPPMCCGRLLMVAGQSARYWAPITQKAVLHSGWWRRSTAMPGATVA